MKKTIGIILVLTVLMTLLSGCGSGKKSVVGQWYNEKGKCLDVRSDGSYKLEGSYGTGTWKYLEDKVTVEFTDFYGDTHESEINEDELGQYITIGGYGDFYKDSYPSEDKIAEVKAKNAESADPFEGIACEVSGISPYCKITVNNKSGGDAQRYITYKLDKDFYSNGETAVITAELSENTGDKSYVLSRTEYEYKVENQPEYVTDLTGIDSSKLKTELNDKIKAGVSASIGTDKIFGEGVNNYYERTDAYKSYDGQIYFTFDKKVESVSENLNSVYFSYLKEQKENLFGDRMAYNICSFVYCMDFPVTVNVTLRDTGDKALNIPCKIFVNIYAINLVKNPDGSIYCGNELCDFNAYQCPDGTDYLIANTIMNNSDNYNITKVDFQ